MKALSLLCLTLAFAPLAPAALKYVAYDLDAKTAESVTNPDVTDEAYHTGSKILFVRDTTLPDQSYYIGVFELTCAQARQLGLSTSATGGEAYGVEYSRDRFLFASPPSLAGAPGLGFPTADQWLAYAEQLKEGDYQSTNVQGGASIGGAFNLASWYNDQKSSWKANSHGVIDMFGNAAEYTYTPATEEGHPAVTKFYGWFASPLTAYQWRNLVKLSPAETALDAFEIKGERTEPYRAAWGARLIYTTPEARTYTLTVTLDGATVNETKDLKEGASVTVTAPKPEGQRRLSGREVTGLDSSISLPEALDATLTFDMPASDVTIAYTTEPYATLTVQNGTATVTHGEETVEANERTQVVPGDVVTLTARALGAHERFTGWTVTVGAGEAQPLGPTESVYRYEIPALDGIASFTFAAVFEPIPYATITVTNGTATVNGQRVTEVEAGDVVTLSPDALGAHQAFLGWTCPEGITLEEGNTFIVPTLQGGERYVFAADIRTYPRVLVFGGSVSGVSNGHGYGDGYYEPGSSLTLRPSAPEGYVHTDWTDGTQSVTSPYPVPDTYDVTITLTALYKTTAESGGEVEPGSGATVRLGYTGNEPRTLFGSEVAEEVTLDDGYGNVYAFPSYVPAGLIATFDLTDGAISYGEPASGAGDPPSKVDYEGTWSQFWQDYMAWWQQAYGSESSHYSPSAFTLRRVTKTDDPYDDFYLGVYEASFGNVANLEILCVPQQDDRLGFLAARTESAMPYCFDFNFIKTEDEEFTLTQRGQLVTRYPVPTLLSMMSGAFGVTVTLPSKSDLVAVAGTPPQNNPEAGRGATKDTAIKESMVACSDNSAVPTAPTVNGMDPDPYGFYGIWGSQFESVAEGQIVGGSRHRKWRFCHVDAFEPIDWGNVYGAGFEATFRPKVAVVRPVTVTVQYRVGSATETIGTVEVAPGLLFEDFAVTPVRANHTFLHWELDGAEVTENPTLADGQTAVTLTAVWEKTPDSVTVKCEHCLGPAVAYPGQTVTVHPPAGQTFDAAAPLTVSPEAAATVGALNEDGTVTVTFASPLPSGGTVTLQGNLATLPEPSRPGYRFRLR